MKLEIVDSTKKLSEMKDRLMCRSIFAMDTETTGLQWWKSKIFMFSFSDGETAWVVPVNKFKYESLRYVLQHIFIGYQKFIVGHNIKFDLHQIKSTFNINVTRQLNDTQIMAHLINENRFKSLKMLMVEDLDIKHQEDEKIKVWLKDNFKLKKDWDFSKVPVELMAPYAGMDAWGTMKLFQKYFPAIKTYFWNLYQNEIKVLRILYKMERNGLRINVPYLEELKEQYEKELFAMEQEMKLQVGEINLNSSKQLSRLLYDGFKLPILGYSEKTHLPSTDDDVLKQLQHPFVAKVLQYRRKKKLHSTYIAALLKHVDSRGYVHGNYNITGTETGRFSCNSPNLQNQAKEPDIKKAFLPDPGCTMWFWDQSQIEMVGFAHYSQEPKMREMFKTGRDIYTETAAEVLKVSFDQVTKGQRQVFKNMNLAMIYGVGKTKLSNFLNMNLDNKVSHKEAIEFRHRYLDTFSGISTFTKYIRDIVMQSRSPWDHFVKNQFGRVRRINPLYKILLINGETRKCCMAYTAVNHLIQGWAADLMKASMVRIEEKLHPNWKQNIHDAIRIDLTSQVSKEYLQEISNCLTDWPEISIPIRVKVEKSNKNWAELEEVK